MIVLTLGDGVNGFTLDPEIGNFILTHPDMKVPEECREFAVNVSNERFWEPPVQRYVDECIRGSTGPRGKDFNMRWIASLVAEVYRILIRGGVFMYPWDTRDTSQGRAPAPAVRGQPDGDDPGAGGRGGVHRTPAHP